MAAEELILSTNEADFLLTGLAEGQRSDGRFLLERRRVRTKANGARHSCFPTQQQRTKHNHSEG